MRSLVADITSSLMDKNHIQIHPVYNLYLSTESPIFKLAFNWKAALFFQKKLKYSEVSPLLFWSMQKKTVSCSAVFSLLDYNPRDPKFSSVYLLRFPKSFLKTKLKFYKWKKMKKTNLNLKQVVIAGRSTLRNADRK